jgi:predicted proteasome-type protease
MTKASKHCPKRFSSVELTSFLVQHQLKLGADNPYLIKMSTIWQNTLKQAAEDIPEIDWDWQAEYLKKS